MSESNVAGVCHPKFSKIKEILFEEAIESGFDTSKILLSSIKVKWL